MNMSADAKTCLTVPGVLPQDIVDSFSPILVITSGSQCNADKVLVDGDSQHITRRLIASGDTFRSACSYARIPAAKVARVYYNDRHSKLRPDRDNPLIAEGFVEVRRYMHLRVYERRT
jgi:hypothetical protein